MMMTMIWSSRTLSGLRKFSLRPLVKAVIEAGVVTVGLRPGIEFRPEREYQPNPADKNND